jgi:L,D-transpeptidase ErfK/SrfK
MKLLLAVFAFGLFFVNVAGAVDVPTAKMPAAEKAVAKIEPQKPKAATPVNYTGAIQTYKAKPDDTLLTIGQKFGLGYVELRSANPAMDPWRPGAGTFVIIPSMHLLPDAPRRGIVVNLSEMRLYHYTKDGIKTYPIGVGREGFSTPVGSTSVTRKTIGPVWTPTERMRREDPKLPARQGPGPDNPLGTHALYLGWPQYLLHGTNKPWGIGRRVSSGCVRMYNEDAQTLYETVPVGTPVTVVRQGIKFGWIDDMLYVEAHPDDVLADQVERGGYTQDYKVPADIFASLSGVAGNSRDNIDWEAVREALKQRRGYPVPILNNPRDTQVFVTASMETRAGTSRFGPRLTQETVVLPKLTAVPTKPAPEEKPPVRSRVRGFNG